MRRLGLLLLLAACAAPAPVTRPPRGEARPVAVTLYRDTLTVRFDDGRLCTLPREARSGGWSGRLVGCPHRWTAVVAQPVGRPRLPLAPGGERVTLTAPGGERIGYGARPGV